MLQVTFKGPPAPWLELMLLSIRRLGGGHLQAPLQVEAGEQKLCGWQPLSQASEPGEATPPSPGVGVDTSDQEPGLQ